MKRIIFLVLCVLLIGFSLAPTGFAAENEREDYEDGSYLIISYSSGIIVEVVGPEGESDEGSSEEDAKSFISRIIDFLKKIIALIFGKSTAEEEESKVKSVSKTKYARYYSSDGELLWYVCLKGYFTFDGEKSECTDASVFYDITDSDWKILSCQASESGNTARGEFEMKQYKLGVPLKTVKKILTLTCDAEGKVE